MANQVFPAGTTATFATITGASTLGTPVAIAGLKSVGEVTREMKFGNVQGLADTEVMEYPSGVTDPGEAEITCFVDDTDPATNFLTVLETAQIAKTKWRISVNLPGSFDNTTPLVGPYNGFIKSVSKPAIEVGDEALTVKFTLRRSAAYVV